MLRYDFESSRRLLYSGAIKTWFKAIFENRKMLFLVLQVVVFFQKLPPGRRITTWSLCFFQKLPPEGQTTPWNLCFFQKLPPEGRIHHETYLLFQNFHQNVKIEIVYTSDTMKGPNTSWNLSFIFKNVHQNVKIEIVYTSDTMKFTYFFKNSPRRARYTMKLMLLSKKSEKTCKKH